MIAIQRTLRKNNKGTFPTGGSDHFAIVLELDKTPSRPPSPFKLNPNWFSHADDIQWVTGV